MFLRMIMFLVSAVFTVTSNSSAWATTATTQQSCEGLHLLGKEAREREGYKETEAQLPLDLNECDATKEMITLDATPLSWVVPLKPSPQKTEFTHAPEQWIPVPDWLAGTWQACTQIILYSYNYRQQRNVIDEPVKLPINRRSTIGAQRDSSGQIWHYTGEPYRRIIETPAYIECQQIEKVELIASTTDSLAVTCLAAVRHSNKFTNETLEEFKEQTITTYEPLRDGLIEVTFLINDYDMQGRPRNSSRSVCIESRIELFHPIDQDDRGNLRELFTDFLRRRASSSPGNR